MAQFIRLRGVVDNGTPYAPTVPKHTAREIALPKLGDTTIEVCVTYPNGEPVMSGSNLTLSVRERTCNGASLAKSGTFLNGVGTILISSADTRAFCASALMYDVWLTVLAKKYMIVGVGNLRLLPNVSANP